MSLQEIPSRHVSHRFLSLIQLTWFQATLMFAAVEYVSGDLKFWSQPTPQPTSARFLPNATGNLVKIPARNVTPGRPSPSFQYHPYHDLEALWWILLWIIFRYFLVLHDKPTIDDSKFEDWQHAHNWLFVSSNVENRASILKEPLRLVRLIERLEAWGWAKEILTISHPVMEFRASLVEAYTALQAQDQDQEYTLNDRIFRRWSLSKFEDLPYDVLSALCLQASKQVKELPRTVSMTCMETLHDEQKKAKRQKMNDD